MAALKELFASLGDTHYCRYYENVPYLAKIDGKIVHLKPQELLEVGRTYPSREYVRIAYFGENPTRVLYFGEDAHSMKKTLGDLRLPNSWPSNLGEKVFYLFSGHLRDINSGPVSLEQQVVSGKEHQFQLVLKKLIESYRSSEQNIHAANNATLSGGVPS